ncbi:AAEL009885-PA [Aedes aegypti]|uniref:AAEL009885-PA n=1 Tax=Aedes aegypti TaxID=7159 RepID=Q16UJ7_AEDAE|nr:AAEL009885-PA [Aedes aegypti]
MNNYCCLVILPGIIVSINRSEEFNLPTFVVVQQNHGISHTKRSLVAHFKNLPIDGIWNELETLVNWIRHEHIPFQSVFNKLLAAADRASNDEPKWYLSFGTSGSTDLYELFTMVHSLLRKSSHKIERLLAFITLGVDTKVYYC